MVENNNTHAEMGQFAKISFDFIENARDLSFHARWLYVALMFYRNGKSGKAFPSYTTIRELTGMRREKIATSIEELEGIGWVRKNRRYARSNLYSLNFTYPLKHSQSGRSGRTVPEPPLATE